jgi:hypothetical protein
MRLSGFGALIIWVAGIPAANAAAEGGRQFPYEAVVASDNVQVRSGKGDQFYPTGVLKRGDRVTVYRHDPGGWCVIAPPPGSFSWIAGEHVRRLDEARGVVTANNVIVRLGSTISDAYNVYHSELSTDDVVEILGERTLVIDGRLKALYKIKPPRDEYRYVPGHVIRPVDPSHQPLDNVDPFATPPIAQQPERIAAPPASIAQDEMTGENVQEGFVERPLVRTGDGDPFAAEAPRDEVPEGQRRRLQELDDRFRAMVKRDVAQWDIAGLERDYRRLRAEASHPDLVSELELRFPAVEKYKRVKSQYDDVMRLASETERRDAQLLSIQRLKPDTAGTAPADGGTAAPLSGSASGESKPRNRPPFDGAGVIQRVSSPAAGAPRYVLAAPDGRLLAYLQGARGVDLDRFVGQAMGVYGNRFRHPGLQADYIVVRGLTPVRLAK